HDHVLAFADHDRLREVDRSDAWKVGVGVDQPAMPRYCGGWFHEPGVLATVAGRQHVLPRPQIARTHLAGLVRPENRDFLPNPDAARERQRRVRLRGAPGYLHADPLTRIAHVIGDPRHDRPRLAQDDLEILHGLALRDLDGACSRIPWNLAIRV